MTWTTPEVTRPTGDLAADERTMLTGLLAWHRSTFLCKCGGLTGEQLAQASVPLLEEIRLADEAAAKGSLDDTFTHGGEPSHSA